MSFLNPIFGLKQYIYETKGPVSNAEMNQIMDQAVKFQKNEAYDGSLITEDIANFIRNIPKPIETISADALVDRLLPYFRVNSQKQSYTKKKLVKDEETGEESVQTLGQGNTRRFFINLGTSAKYVSFIPDTAELGEQLEADPHDGLRSISGIYSRKGNIVRVVMSRLDNALNGNRFTKELRELYDEIIDVLPIDINIPKRNVQERKNLLRGLSNTADAVLDAKRTSSDRLKDALTPVGEEGQFEKFQKEWPTIKKEIANRVPIGRVPSREVIDSVGKYLKGKYTLDKLAAPLFSVNSPLEEELEERVSQRPGSPTYGELIFKAILKKASANAFKQVQLDRDYASLEEDDSFFNKMEIADLPEDERRRVKTFLQDAEPTEFFGEEYLKLTKLINTLADVVDSSEEEELEGMDEENLKLIKKLAHLRKRYEKLYQEIYGMVYGEEE